MATQILMPDPGNLAPALNALGPGVFLLRYGAALEHFPVYFFDDLHTVPVEGTVKHARVIKRWRVWVRELGCVLTVAPGFEFDWDSVPRLPVVYLLFKGRIKEEACLHDYLYKYQRACGKPVTWWQSERILAQSMRVMDRKWYWRLGIRTGTAVGGWIPWRRYRRERHSE